MPGTSQLRLAGWRLPRPPGWHLSGAALWRRATDRFDAKAGINELADGDLQERLEELIGDVASARAERLGDLTVAELASLAPGGR